MLDPDWEGRSLEAPYYYGLRATWWRTPLWGVGAEFNHAKAYASEEALRLTGYERLEFIDGLNLLTLHLVARAPTGGRLTPYLGLGAGAALPWIEVQAGPGQPETDALRWGGPAVVAFAGASYALTEPWSAFGELKAGYARVSSDLAGDGRIEAEIATSALNIGLSLTF